ncbi:protein AF-10-like isoform X2 [Ptychodera flava]|uniref:protein AF-10-like isoform X2 n=1 Tax=Ptychodera flava TaxID=63121 RepID=UPI003969D7BC
MAKEMIGGCCVCSDERGWAENPLVYCDGHGCNVAVHQACYGIVTVPTGPWFCRKCESQERAARVRCELCPHREGALKRTDNGGWAHVVCALYIPEVRFGNVTTMEPILLSMVPHERYNKVCYICEHQHRESKASTGACMTCNKNGCRQSFHVTCAQMQGLLCEEAGQFTDNVKYCGYCEYHYNKLKKDKDTIKTIPAFKHHYTTTPEKEKAPEKKHEKHKQRKKHAVSTEASVVTQTEYEKTRTEVAESIPMTSGSSSLKCLEETAAKFTSANFTETEFTSNKPIGEPSPTEVVTPPLHKPKKHSGQRGRKPGPSKSALAEIASVSGRSDSPSSTASQPDLPGLGLPEINAINAADHRATPSDDASSTKSKSKSQARSSKDTSREPTPSRMPSVTTETIEHKDLPLITTSTSTPPPISIDTTLATITDAPDIVPGKTYESSYHDFMMKYSQVGVGSSKPAPQRHNKEPTVSPITIVKSPDKHDKKKHRVKKNKAHPGRPKGAKTVKDLINESSQPSPKKSRKSSTSSLNNSVNTVNSSFNFALHEVNAMQSGPLPPQLQSGPLPPHLLPQGSPTRHLTASQSSTSTLGLSGSARAGGEASLSGSMNSNLSQQLCSNQLSTSNTSMPSLVPENADLAANQVASDTAFRDVFSTAANNGLLIGPQRHHAQSNNTLQRTNTENSSTVPPFPATMEELLERQWEQGSEFLMQQGAHFDIASLLSCLHQLRAENQRLEEHIKNLLARRDHLLAVNARLSVPLGNSIGAGGGSTDNSPNGPTGRSPRINNLIHPDTPQGHSQDVISSHGSVSQTSRSPGTSIHSNSPGQGSQPPQLPVSVPTGPLQQVPTTPPHPQAAPSLHPQQTAAAVVSMSMAGQLQGNHNAMMQPPPPSHGPPQSAMQQPSVQGQFPDGRMNMPTHHQDSSPDSQRYRDQQQHPMRETNKEHQVREHQRQHLMLQQQQLNNMLQQQQLTQEQHQHLVFQLMHQQSAGPGQTAAAAVIQHGGNGHMPHIQMSPQGSAMPTLHMNGEHSGLPPDSNLSKASQGKKGSSSHGNKS